MNKVDQFSKRLKEAGLTSEQSIAALEALIEYNNTAYEEHVNAQQSRNGGR